MKASSFLFLCEIKATFIALTLIYHFSTSRQILQHLWGDEEIFPLFSTDPNVLQEDSAKCFFFQKQSFKFLMGSSMELNIRWSLSIYLKVTIVISYFEAVWKIQRKSLKYFTNNVIPMSLHSIWVLFLAHCPFLIIHTFQKSLTLF